jgi:fumarate reductase flavoprotein subunit
MAVLPAKDAVIDAEVPIAIVGGGACGIVAALAAHDAGTEALVLERDPVGSGSTALSSGMIPACDTRIQRAAGIDDSADIMSADIQKKARGEADAGLVETVCRTSGPVIDWLTGDHGLDLTLVEGFLYPGHSRLRMHAPKSRTGADLIGGLSDAAGRAGITQMTDAHVVDLFADEQGRVTGLRIERPDGATESIGCAALVLACNGFGGNRGMVREQIPAMAEADYFGHPGNQGDAVLWGQALGAAARHMGSYQGHGWSIRTESGFPASTTVIRNRPGVSSPSRAGSRGTSLMTASSPWAGSSTISTGPKPWA